MSYLVLARKWRPQRFEEVVGQKHITQTLTNAILKNRVAHAYLFAGPRGVGKTTTARILAKALNCEEGPTPTPCNRCIPCREITESRSPDVIEIDGASNRGIDDVKALRERVQYAPQGRFRIFIIDEVHMLTREAFNALLKTLEEPPDNVVFIFATTEPHKLPPTILSRCQRFDFKRLPMKLVKEKITNIAENEGKPLSEKAAITIAKHANGGMRDALSALDQILAYSKEKTITEEDVFNVIGILPQEIYLKLIEHIFLKRTKEAISLLKETILRGADPKEIARGLLDEMRNILLAKLNVDISEEIAEELIPKVKELAGKKNLEDLYRAFNILLSSNQKMKYSPNPMYVLEEEMVKLSRLESVVLIEDLIKGVKAPEWVEPPAPKDEEISEVDRFLRLLKEKDSQAWGIIRQARILAKKEQISIEFSERDKANLNYIQKTPEHQQAINYAKNQIFGEKIPLKYTIKQEKENRVETIPESVQKIALMFKAKRFNG
ncbi:DNA polymerase III subunit gamma/tau [bacterium]|nr:DNA polymerase III subunit gamma/tau [bacterium]